MKLTPTFSGSVTAYTATTSNASNKVTATPTDDDATVEILLGETEIENATNTAWEAGENTLTITVTNGTSETVYTVTVTKE